MNTYVVFNFNIINKKISDCFVVDFDKRIAFCCVSSKIGDSFHYLKDPLIDLYKYNHNKDPNSIYIKLNDKNKIRKILETNYKEIHDKNFIDVIIQLELEEYLI